MGCYFFNMRMPAILGKKTFCKMSTSQKTMQNWFGRDSKNQKVTPARGGENWFPHDNRDTLYSFFTHAVSQNIFVCLPSYFVVPLSFKVEMLQPEKRSSAFHWFHSGRLS